MKARDMPRDQWQTEAFSRQHAGWIVDVAVSGADGRVLTEARDLPPQGVSADTPHGDRIAIMAGERPDDHLTHEVVRAVAVAVETTDAGEERGPRIDAADGFNAQLSTLNFQVSTLNAQVSTLNALDSQRSTLNLRSMLEGGS